MSDEIVIRAVDADEAVARIDDLIEVIRDSVAHGASVNFLADVSDDELRRFWMSSIDEQRARRRILFVAEVDEHIIGTTLLMLAQQPNQSHRADIGKMIVHSSFRRRGLGRQMLAVAEKAALERGRMLLILDTEKDSSGERLYVSAGWVRYGEVPGHARRPDGTPWPTSFFYKVLSN